MFAFSSIKEMCYVKWLNNLRKLAKKIELKKKLFFTESGEIHNESSNPAFIHLYRNWAQESTGRIPVSEPRVKNLRREVQYLFNHYWIIGPLSNNFTKYWICNFLRFDIPDNFSASLRSGKPILQIVITDSFFENFCSLAFCISLLQNLQFVQDVQLLFNFETETSGLLY